MSQIFGIHAINGLPIKYNSSDINTYLADSPYDISSYNTPNTDNISSLSPSSVYIASDPAGAKIFIDGIEQTGFMTPSMITDIPAGHHNFKLTSPGRVDIESSIPLEPGKTYNMFLTMGKTISNVSDSISMGTSDFLLLVAIGIMGYLLIKHR